MSQTLNLIHHKNLIKLNKLKFNYKKKILQLELNGTYRQLDYCYNSLKTISKELYKTVLQNILGTFICSQEKALNKFQFLTRYKLDTKISVLKNKTYKDTKPYLLLYKTKNQQHHSQCDSQYTYGKNFS